MFKNKKFLILLLILIVGLSICLIVQVSATQQDNNTVNNMINNTDYNGSINPRPPIGFVRLTINDQTTGYNIGPGYKVDVCDRDTGEHLGSDYTDEEGTIEFFADNFDYSSAHLHCRAYVQGTDSTGADFNVSSDFNVLGRTFGLVQ
ncbi:MAG: hypothetical protein MJ209_02770 [archaeon]|nr:hypothetical protein [archaeon]